MQACSGAHHWAREFGQFGHTIRLKAPKFVAPYCMSGKRGKNDAADAAAIAEAVTRPNMRFVPIKSIEQQSRQLMQLGGIGPTTASAIVAMVGKGHDLTCGRQFCAWLGLVPGQYSSGGKQRRGYWKAVVAIAAKNARMCWAMLQRGDAFKIPA